MKKICVSNNTLKIKIHHTHRYRIMKKRTPINEKNLARVGFAQNTAIIKIMYIQSKMEIAYNDVCKKSWHMKKSRFAW